MRPSMGKEVLMPQIAITDLAGGVRSIADDVLATFASELDGSVLQPADDGYPIDCSSASSFT